MYPTATLLSLASLAFVASATALECMIYVSSSDGINNTSCWIGGYETPCATLDLALQGTTTVQDNCSSGTVINLSPGNYTLNTATVPERLQKNSVSIIGMRNGSRYEEVNITCLHVSSSSYHWFMHIAFQCVSLYNCNNDPVLCTDQPFGLTTHNAVSQELCPLTLDVKPISLALECYDYGIYCDCDYLLFNVNIVDSCTKKAHPWKNDLYVCVTYVGVSQCYITEVQTFGCFDFLPYFSPYDSWYELNNTCFNKSINAGPSNVSLYVQTNELISISTNIMVEITSECDRDQGYIFADGKCHYNPYNDPGFTPVCHEKILTYLIPVNEYDYSDYGGPKTCPCNDCCYNNKTEQCYINCTLDSGVPINNLTCIQCEHKYIAGFLVFILIEIQPITIIVLLILALNIKLTNGFINGVIFYSQMMNITYNSTYVSTGEKYFSIPCNIFNLDFTLFLINYPICITPYMSPLGAISFWYIVGLYPLILLLLIYVWIVLYDKGFRCVAFITRPFHRCMARFWDATGIEPSFTHSTASVYILCFSQLAATSFKILSFNLDDTSSLSFFYDAKQKFFDGAHCFAGFIAILMLLFLILLPTLYIQFYPFRLFHKLLDCLHLRKQLLISLGDVFTGPYKNGSDNTSDYRFMAGLYLLARLIILSQLLFGFPYYVNTLPIILPCCFFLLAVVNLIFRPFQKSFYTFFEFFIAIVGGTVGYAIYADLILLFANCLMFLILIPVYILFNQLLLIFQ